jgi:hypothetical protein
MPGPVTFDRTLIENTRTIMNLTERKWPMWFENCAENLPLIRQGKNLNVLDSTRKGAAIIVGGGPSFQKFQHASLLANYRDKIPTIITADRMLKSLLIRTCNPDFVATVDGDASVSQFYDLHSDERGAKVDVVLDAVTTHPLTVKKARENLKGDMYWFTHFLDDPTDERCPTCNRLSLTAAFYYLAGQKTIIQAAGNVGAFCWELAYFLGCDPIILTGMDMSYLEGTPPEKTLYYNSFIKSASVEHIAMGSTKEELAKLEQKQIEHHAATCAQCHAIVKIKTFQVRENPDFLNRYLIDTVFDMYSGMLKPMIERATATTVNATGGGALHGGKIVSMNLEDAIRKYCN